MITSRIAGTGAVTTAREPRLCDACPHNAKPCLQIGPRKGVRRHGFGVAESSARRVAAMVGEA
jgi:TPP-dependent indolepyruvate ferredoxin oxidoreductase alpha subunit